MQYMDQSAILAGGQALVPDYLERDLKRRLGAAQIENFAVENAKNRAAMSEQQQFQSAVTGLQENPTPQKWAAIAARFPKYANELKSAFAMSQQPQQQADQRRMGEMYSAARNGRWDLVERSLEERVEADRAAGQEDPYDVAALEALKSGDPSKREQVVNMLGTHLAISMGPEHFASVYGALGLKPETPAMQQQYDFLVRTRGKEAADKWLAAETSTLKIVPVESGGRAEVVDMSVPFSGGTSPTGAAEGPQPGGGQARGPVAASPAMGGAAPVANAAAIVTSLYPQARITDWKRDPKSKLGRKNPGSWHNRSGAAVDTPPIPGMSFEEYVASFRRHGLTVIEQRDEVKNPSRHATGPHWHVVLGYKQVRSVQEARALPKGTMFVTPDGRVKVR